MSQNDRIKVISQRVVFLSRILAGFLLLNLSGCENALVEAAKALQVEAVSPKIIMTISDNSLITLGGNIDLGKVSLRSNSDLELTIKNTGVNDLLLDISEIILTMDSSTEDDTFLLKSNPSDILATNVKSSLVIRFTPISEGTKSATFTIPTNDPDIPIFSFIISGTGWPVIITTNAVSLISTTSATGGGVITDDGGQLITERGICWNTSQNPIISDSKQKDTGSGLGSFANIMTGLTPGEFYYVRAYATNSLGTGYGSQVSFSTLPAAPSTPIVSPIGFAEGSGKLDVSWSAVNGAAVYYDVYYSTSNTFASAITAKTDLSAISCTLSGLTNYTPYYIWIVTKNATGSSSPSATMSSPVAPGIPVTGINLTSRVSILPTATNQLTATITPDNATNPTITWSSSNSSIASISTTGMITAVQIGNATITAATSGNALTVQCLIAVTGIITIGGNGIEGTTTSNSSGLGTSISIGRPAAITTDKDGNVYFTDPSNYCVRKITPDGLMSTIAGNGTDGLVTAGSNAATASLPSSYGIMVDSNFNIYLSCSDQRIRKINSSGSFVTIAGNGSLYDPLPAPFTEGGLATSMPLGGPTNSVLDVTGNVYFVDGFRYRVRRIDFNTNILSTICGTGVASFSGDGSFATAATIHNSGGIAIDSSGNIYLADASNNRIRKINTGGIITTIAGNGASYPYDYNGDQIAAISAVLWNPQSVVLDEAGNVYFSDSMHSRIRKVDTNGIITTVAGDGTEGSSGDGGPAISAQLKLPSGVAVDSLGNLYIADTNNYRIRKVIR